MSNEPLEGFPVSGKPSGVLVIAESVKPDRLDRNQANVFYGEFDSGSERTLAAWIRHASRTGLFL